MDFGSEIPHVKRFNKTRNSSMLRYATFKLELILLQKSTEMLVSRKIVTSCFNKKNEHFTETSLFLLHLNQLNNERFEK